MLRRRIRRLKAKDQRPALPHRSAPESPPVVIREAKRVVRLAYTRTQAAEALGISRSTFTRRVLPLVETIEMPWGARLIPVDELERSRARATNPRSETGASARDAWPPRRPFRFDVVNRIRAERAAGNSLRQIAADLNATATPTGHGGKRWWPSTVRAVLVRQSPLRDRRAMPAGEGEMPDLFRHEHGGACDVGRSKANRRLLRHAC